jgi:hypothetical protein
VAVRYAVRGLSMYFTYSGTNGNTVVWNSSQSAPGRSICTATPNNQPYYIEKIVSASTLATIINNLVQGLR